MNYVNASTTPYINLNAAKVIFCVRWLVRKPRYRIVNCTKLMQDNSSDGRVARAFAYGAVNSSLIPSGIKPMSLIKVFTAFLLDAHH